MKYVCFTFILILLSRSIYALEFNSIQADFRHRPPEMQIENGQFSGPLKDILDEAAAKIGFQVIWRQVPFARSLQMLRNGQTDIVPRTIRTTEREGFINYLGPIAHQVKNIVFVVKKGSEASIQQYQDLQGLKIAVKRKTAYFPKFNQDTSLSKEELLDDDNMVRMFEKGRFDVMAVLDKDALQAAMTKYDITNFAYAHYQYKQIIANYYGMSQTSKNAILFHDLIQALKEMLEQGRIGDIYKKYGLTLPTKETH